MKIKLIAASIAFGFILSLSLMTAQPTLASDTNTESTTPTPAPTYTPNSFVWEC